MKKWVCNLALVGCFVWGVSEGLSQDFESKEVYIDKGACPSECCTYGSWEVRQNTDAYASPDVRAVKVGEFKAGTKVRAMKGSSLLLTIKDCVGSGVSYVTTVAGGISGGSVSCNESRNRPPEDIFREV